MAACYARASGGIGVACHIWSGRNQHGYRYRHGHAGLFSGRLHNRQVSSKSWAPTHSREIDITGITMPITKHNVVGHPKRRMLRALSREAFLIANSGRPGPVLVDITKDAQQASAEFNWEGSVPKLPPKRRRNNHEPGQNSTAPSRC